MKNLNRRSFLVLGSLTIGSLVITGCSAPESSVPQGLNAPNTTPGSCSAGSSALYSNPGHAHTTMSLTAMEIANAAPGNYTLMGGSHPHSFNITAANFNSLKSGSAITKMDLEGHGHVLTITC